MSQTCPNIDLVIEYYRLKFVYSPLVTEKRITGWNIPNRIFFVFACLYIHIAFRCKEKCKIHVSGGDKIQQQQIGVEVDRALKLFKQSQFRTIAQNLCEIWTILTKKKEMLMK